MDWLGASMAHPGIDAARPFYDRTGLLEDLRARMRAQRGFTIATLNLDHAVKLRTDPAFRAAYAAHSHVTADGHPVVWLERLAGRRAELVTGADLVVPLARLAAQERCPIALVGTTPDSLAAAARTLIDRAPGVSIALQVSPPLGFDPMSEEAGRIIDRLERSGAGLCLLALGAPRQEIFAARAAARLPGCGFASIGAGLDYLSGHQRRAPRLLRAAALEWAWRLSLEPRRLGRRYALCAMAMPSLAMAALRARAPQNGKA